MPVIAMLALFWVELNVLCNPFSPTLVFHWYKSCRVEPVRLLGCLDDPRPSAGREGAGAFRDHRARNPRTIDRPDHPGMPEIDDTIALVPKIKLLARACFEFSLPSITVVHFEESRPIFEASAPKREPPSLHSLCRLRC